MSTSTQLIGFLPQTLLEAEIARLKTRKERLVIALSSLKLRNMLDVWQEAYYTTVLIGLDQKIHKLEARLN